MADQPPSSVSEVLAVTDPGEIGRAHHLRGDRIVVRFANIASWAFPILMACIVAQVILRGAGHNQAWLDDLQWWIYGFAMMAGLGYAITTGSHVRVDIFHQHFSEEKKARIEAFALGWMLLPFIVLMTDILVHYAISSVESGEGSDSPNGLHRLYLLKISMPILFAITGIGAWAALRRSLKVIQADNIAGKIWWAFPAIVFVLWRVMHYIVYWFIRMTNAELNPRRITKEPIFEYLMLGAFVVVALVLVLTYLSVRRANAGGDT